MGGLYLQNMQGLEVSQDIHLTNLIDDACKEIQLIHLVAPDFGDFLDCPM